MKKPVFLECMFLFDAEDAWSNIYDFERDLSKFLKALGLEGKLINAVRGSTDRRIIYVSRIKDLLQDPSKSWRDKKV